MKHVTPSVSETAFNCPYCHALCTQFWHNVFASRIKKGEVPLVITRDLIQRLDPANFYDEKTFEQNKRWAEKCLKGNLFFDRRSHEEVYAVSNVWFSRCYNCDEVSVWIYDRLIHPQTGEAELANPDMPEDIRRDYEEASTILAQSPRAAAALIRLGIDKLCRQLGDPKKSINDNIKAFVENGLNSRVQKALDAVRVIGNNAVHPGQLDLKDDRATAESLCRLLNIIVDKMISEPKHVDNVYSSLPESARDAIRKRDAK